MAERLKFEIGLTDSMSPVLRGIASDLARTEDSMESVRVEGGYLAESLKMAADQIKRSGGSVKDHTALLKAMREAERAGAGGASARDGTALGRVLADIESAPVDGPRFTERIDKFRRLKVEWGNFVHSFAGFRREVNAAGEAQWTFNLAEGLGAVARGASFAARSIFDLGSRMVRAVGAAEDLDLATRLQVGEGGAGQLAGIADAFGGGRTRFDDDVIKRGLLPLLRAGVRDSTLLGNVATAGTDIETLTGGETTATEAMRALGKIRLKRDFGEKQLEALGLNAEDTFAALAEQLGKTAEATKKLVGAGKVEGDVLLDVVLKRLADQQGGALGKATLEGGKTLGATLQRLSDLPENLLKNAKGSEGLTKLQAALDGIVETLSGPTGVQLVSDFAASLGVLVDIGRGVASIFGAVGDAIGWTAAQLYMGGEAFWNFAGTAFDKVLDVGASVLDFFVELPGKLAQGFVDGMTSAWQSVRDSVVGAAESTIGWMKEALGIASPSRVFRELGAYTGEGFALGLEDSETRVQGATSALIAMPAGGGATSATSTGDGARTAYITIHVADGRGAVDEIEGFLDRYFDRVNYAQATP